MNKMLVFDMDGTIADFYGVDGWLEAIKKEDPFPYVAAAPIYGDALNHILLALKDRGWKIVIITWLAKGSSKTYDAMVREAKLTWLDKVHFPYDEIHMVKYGTTKANCTRHHGGFQILIDDNPQVRKGWNLGDTIDANFNIMAELCKLF